MKSILILTILLLLLTTSVLAMDPPAIEWERLYFSGNYSRFFDVIETWDGGYATAGYNSDDFWETSDSCLMKFDSSGDIEWAVSAEFHYHNMMAILQLESGGFISVGKGKVTSASTYSLIIIHVNPEGQIEWTKSYDIESSNEIGHDILQLPDGGFAICGEISPAEGMNQAWILRTDALGDTLWTREWGWEYWDYASSILFVDNGLTVLCQGRPTSEPGGPYLVRYDLDGNLLWETTLEFSCPGGSTPQAQEMCRASDGGLLLLDNYHPEIAHFNILGNFDWYFQPPGNGDNYGWSVSTTMDGGILYAGENRWMEPNGSKSELSGMISRHDFQGNELWRDYVYNSGCTALYSACQLSQGGYIAAGKAYSSTDGYQGYLIKYAPELGIESGNVPVVEITSVSPNPFSSSLSITCSLPSQLETSLTVYDLNGRIVDVVEAGSFPVGEHTVSWTPSSELSSGCYLIKLHTDAGTDVRNCVLLGE